MSQYFIPLYRNCNIISIWLAFKNYLYYSSFFSHKSAQLDLRKLAQIPAIKVYDTSFKPLLYSYRNKFNNLMLPHCSTPHIFHSAAVCHILLDFIQRTTDYLSAEHNIQQPLWKSALIIIAIKISVVVPWSGRWSGGVVATQKWIA